MFARLLGAGRALAASAGSTGRLLLNASSALCILGLACAWAFGHSTLQRYVGSFTKPSTDVCFNWPLAPAPGEKIASGKTWLPPSIQNDMARIARANLTTDPFEQPCLEYARESLASTGWFVKINSIRRQPGGRIDVSADWRTPVALVSYRGHEYLVAVGSEILKLPARTPVAKGTMPVIMNPHLGPPSDQLGVLYGQTWTGGDVQAAVDLLRSLRQLPESRRVAGVDLANYIKSGHLTLITDTGSRIVWGSAPGELGPGEVRAEVRIQRLKDILAKRLDAQEKFIEIHTPDVLVDKTAARN